MMTKEADMAISSETYTLLVIIKSVVVFSGWVFVGVLAALVMMALTPPRTHAESFGMIACAFGSSLFVGPLFIEAYHLSHYSLQAQLGICFIFAAPAWMFWSVVRVIMQKWRDAKDPVDKISRDVKKIKGWWL